MLTNLTIRELTVKDDAPSEREPCGFHCKYMITRPGSSYFARNATYSSLTPFPQPNPVQFLRISYVQT